MNVAVLGTLASGAAESLVEIGACHLVASPSFSALCAEAEGVPGGDGYGWDRNEDTYARYPSDSDNLYTKIDFGESKYVHSIRVRWGGIDKERTCTIATSPDDSTWTTIATWDNLNTYYESISDWFTINRADVRYIRIMRGEGDGYIRSYCVEIKVRESDVTELTASASDITALSPTAWYDANNSGSITQSGGVVSAWNDISGNGYHSAQTTVEKRPTVVSDVLNSLPVIRFNHTSNQMLDVTTTAKGVARNIGALTIFAVGTNNGGDTYRVILSFSTASGGLRTTSYFKDAICGTGGRRLDANSFQYVEVAQSGTSIICSEFDYTNAEAYISKDGTRKARGGFQTSGNTSDTDSSIVGIGDLDGSCGLTGDIAEIIVFNSILSTANRQQVEGYLAQKWGLGMQLPWDHPYYDKY